MSSVDAPWRRMDAPSNLMAIMAVMICADPLDLQRVKELRSARLLLKLAQVQSQHGRSA